MSASMLWALWITASNPHIAAYFYQESACVQMQTKLPVSAGWSQCIQAPYVIVANPVK